MKKSILVCGLPHVSEKIARHYGMLRDMTGVEPVLYSRDVTSHSQSIAAKFGVCWESVPSGKEKDLRRFLQLIGKEKPAHIEMYHDSAGNYVHLMYLLIAHMNRVPVVLFCRGGELLFWEQHSTVRKFVFLLGLRTARVVLYKQLHMKSQLDQLHISTRKTYFFHNRIPVSSQRDPVESPRNGCLFLNSWRAFRRPDIALEVGLRLAKDYPEYSFYIAGHRTWAREAYSKEAFVSKIKSLGLENRIYILPWVKDPSRLFSKCNIFLLPADPVFLNYTLLEAMEKGLVPVIARADGAELIVDHGRNGLIADIQTEAFVDAVRFLLSHPEKRARMGIAARETVNEKFNLERGMKDLIDVYQKNVW